MRRLRRFLDLAPRERALLAEACALILLARAALALLPFADVRALVRRAARPSRRRRDAISIGKAVESARRILPRAGTCLPAALAAHTLLARAGLPSQLSIGIAPDAAGPLRAHAWVEGPDGIVVGGDVRQGYRRVYLLEAS